MLIHLFRLFAVNSIYIQGTFIDSLNNANTDISSISALWRHFDERELPSITLAAFNMTAPHVLEVRALIVESGLQQQLQNLESTIAAHPDSNFGYVHNVLKLLFFQRITNIQITVGNNSGSNIFGNMSGEFSRQRHFVHGLSRFSQKIINAVSWVDPWIASSWPWLFVVALSFLQLQSVVLRSISMFSAIFCAAACLQFVFAFLAFILFSISIIINDGCALLPESDAANWQIVTESSHFWNRFGR